MSKLNLIQVKMLAELLGMEYGHKRVDAYREGSIGEFEQNAEHSGEMSALMAILESDLHNLNIRAQTEMMDVFCGAWQEVTNSYHEECKAKFSYFTVSPNVKVAK